MAEPTDERRAAILGYTLKGPERTPIHQVPDIAWAMYAGDTHPFMVARVHWLESALLAAMENLDDAERDKDDAIDRADEAESDQREAEEERDAAKAALEDNEEKQGNLEDELRYAEGMRLPAAPALRRSLEILRGKHPHTMTPPL